jgi:hypothetical protein
MARKLPHGYGSTESGRDGLFDIGLARLRDLGHELSGERINDRGRDLALLPLTMNEKRTGFLHWRTRWSL